MPQKAPIQPKLPITPALSGATMNIPIPYVIERHGREERAMDIYSRLLKDRIIILGSGINDTVSNSIVAQLLFLQFDDGESDIHMYVNSPGGSITSGMAIYDTMQYIGCDVGDLLHRPGLEHGSDLAGSRHGGKTQRSAKQSHHDPPAPGWHGRHGDRPGHPCP